ncbi:hypothetical protein D3C85_1541780 [compost metagenome]
MAFDAPIPNNAPTINPPAASLINNQEILPNEISMSLLCVNCKITAKTTTATPSLNSDSPATFVSNDFFTLASFNTPITAIGSVGDINAPNNKQYKKGISSPNSGAM